MAMFGKKITLFLLFHLGIFFCAGAQSFFWSGEQPKNSADIKETGFIYTDSLVIFTNVRTKWTKYGPFCHRREKHAISAVMTSSDAKKISQLKGKTLILKIKTMLENGEAYILYEDCKDLFPSNLELIPKDCQNALASSYRMNINAVALFPYKGGKIQLTKENAYSPIKCHNFLVVVINVFDIERWQPFITYDDNLVHDHWCDYFETQKQPIYIPLIFPLNSNTF